MMATAHNTPHYVVRSFENAEISHGKRINGAHSMARLHNELIVNSSACHCVVRRDVMRHCVAVVHRSSVA